MAGRAPSLLTSEALLRDVTEADLPIFFDHQRDPEATRMAAFPSRDRQAFMAHWAKILADATVITRAILVDGQVAGNVVSWEQFGKQEVGYWIGKHYWGQGVATRALSAFLGLVSVRPLYAYVAKHNIGSIRVLEKCGFTIVGEDREASGADGDEIDQIILKLG
jgi:RimJ/RimL family protein N-acetyltransferase